MTNREQISRRGSAFRCDALGGDSPVERLYGVCNYGLTDAVYIAVVVPIVQLNLSGERVNIYRGGAEIWWHARAANRPVSGHCTCAAGAIRPRRWRLDAAVELRLPTGSVDDLRGSGRAAVKGSLITSAVAGPVEAHVNASSRLAAFPERPYRRRGHCRHIRTRHNSAEAMVAG